MKLHLPKGLFVAVMAACGLVQSAFGYQVEVTQEGDTWANDYMFSFVLTKGMLSGSNTSDVLFVYGGKNYNDNLGSNAIVLNYDDTNGITLQVGRGNLDNNDSGKSMSDYTYTFDDENNKTSPTALTVGTVGTVYTVSVTGADQSMQLTLSGGNLDAPVVLSAYNGNMLGNVGNGKAFTTEFNQSYTLGDFVWAGTGESAALDYTSSNWTNQYSTTLVKCADIVLNAGETLAKNLTIGSSIYVNTVKVNDNYTITGTSADAKLDASTITIADGKTLTFGGTLTLTGTVSGNITIADGTLRLSDRSSSWDPGSVTVGSGSVLDLTPAYSNLEGNNNYLFDAVVDKANSVNTTGTGYVLSGGTGTDWESNAAHVHESVTLSSKLVIATNLNINGRGWGGDNANANGAAILVEDGASLKVGLDTPGQLALATKAALTVKGSVTAGKVLLGHHQGNSSNDYFGSITLEDGGNLTIDSISFQGKSASNAFTMNGGVLKVTGEGDILTSGSYKTGDTVNQSGGTGKVNIVSGTLQTADKDWTLNGSDAISVSVGNVIIDAANKNSITLSNVTLNGPITNNATLKDGAAGLIISGTNTYAANTTMGGTGSTLISGAVTGSTAITKTGTGTLELSGANTYSGGTEINAGTVKTSNATALGTGAVSVAKDASLELGSSLTVSDLRIAEGGTLIFGNGAQLTATGSLTLGNISLDLTGYAAGSYTLVSATNGGSISWEKGSWTHNGTLGSDLVANVGFVGGDNKTLTLTIAKAVDTVSTVVIEEKDGSFWYTLNDLGTSLTLNVEEDSLAGLVEGGLVELKLISERMKQDILQKTGRTGDDVAVTLYLSDGTRTIEAGKDAIVGFYNEAHEGYWGEQVGNSCEYELDRIPEPTTSALSLLALCGLAARRRRRK